MKIYHFNNQIMTALKKYHHQILPIPIKLNCALNQSPGVPGIDPYIGNAYIDSFTEFTKDEIDQMSIPRWLIV